jgi:hypothetical protein
MVDYLVGELAEKEVTVERFDLTEMDLGKIATLSLIVSFVQGVELYP